MSIPDFHGKIHARFWLPVGLRDLMDDLEPCRMVAGRKRSLVVWWTLNLTPAELREAAGMQAVWANNAVPDDLMPARVSFTLPAPLAGAFAHRYPVPQQRAHALACGIISVALSDPLPWREHDRVGVKRRGKDWEETLATAIRAKAEDTGWWPLFVANQELCDWLDAIAFREALGRCYGPAGCPNFDLHEAPPEEVVDMGGA